MNWVGKNSEWQRLLDIRVLVFSYFFVLGFSNIVTLVFAKPEICLLTGLIWSTVFDNLMNAM